MAIDDPFYLGIEGEQWKADLPGLFVPLPGTDKGVAVLKSGLPGMGYVVVSQSEWLHVDSLLMVAALVVEILEAHLNERVQTEKFP